MTTATREYPLCHRPSQQNESSSLKQTNGWLQRKCSCGGTPSMDGQCDECRKKELGVQRSAVDVAGPMFAPPIVHEVLKSFGQPLDAETLAYMEPRFGHSFSRIRINNVSTPQSKLTVNQPNDIYEKEADQVADSVMRLEEGPTRARHDFSHVRIHADFKAAESSRAVGALAYTVGSHIVFGAGQHAPHSAIGRRLIAHELAHIVQQQAHPTECVHRQKLIASKAEQSNCGPGTDNRFCLPIPGPHEPCKPFDTLDHALSVWANDSATIPLIAAAATRCNEVKPVWDTYFAASSTPFAFSNPSSCVVKAALTDPQGSEVSKRAAQFHLKDILDNLPFTLRTVSPKPFSLGGPMAELRLPLEDAIGLHGPSYLHPNIVFNDPFNAAANIAGAVGSRGEGSDIFGDDDRQIGGNVIIEVNAIDPMSGAMRGQVRWQPHIHVKDTVDFCPGNLGNSFQRPYTLSMSKLEAMGLTRDVPITIDYDLDIQQANFDGVVPIIGPLSPRPVPTPPIPVQTFPRSGAAKTTGR